MSGFKTIPKGTLVLCTVEDSDDYRPVGVYKALMDITKEIAEKAVETYVEGAEGPYRSPNDLALHLVKTGLVEKVKTIELHLGEYGSVGLTNFGEVK